MHNTQTQQGPAVSVTPAAPAPAAAKITTTALDDLDDDFEGLEDAKEGSVADDDFATLSRSGLDDLNAVFDSRSSMGGGGQGKGAGAHSGHEVSFDLVSASSLPSQPSQPGGTTATAAKAGAGEPHDWDAIFASLDDAGAVTSPTRLGGGGGGGGAATERPAVAGRALTEEGQHDDPILKNLTSMGYARGQALAALEKYDYNLERVS